MGKYKTTDGMKRLLKDEYEKNCNKYLLELYNMWELDAHYGYWVSDNIGGTLCYGDTGLFIDMDNIRYCVENDISYSQYMEWLDYCVWAADFEQDVPNLKSWCKGCPRVDVATQEKLSAMRTELMRTIEETKTKVSGF